MADIVGFRDDGLHIALATGGGGFAAPQFALAEFGAGAGVWTSFDAEPRQLADVNGGGAVDVIGFGSDGVHVALATADFFV